MTPDYCAIKRKREVHEQYTLKRAFTYALGGSIIHFQVHNGAHWKFWRS